MVPDKRIVEFYKKLDRSLFMGKLGHLASVDSAFPIGYGQTISQPSLVLEMTVMLGMCSGDRVLEIGTGSGYQTALLAEFAEEVYTVERIPELMKSAKERLAELGYGNIRFMLGDGSSGWEEHSPYDRIMVTAAAYRIPEKLVEQLAAGGRMVVPVGHNIQRINIVDKDMNGSIEIREGIPVRFVRLVGDY